MRHWWEARLPHTDTLLLTHRNVYILPTRAGLLFALTLVVLLLASINYQLNLGYALTFLLAGAGAASMHWTHGNLRGLTLRLMAPAGAAVGEAVLLDTVLASPGRARHALATHLGSRDDAHPVWVDVPAGGEARAQVAFVARQRGLQGLPAIGIETRFPLGLFRAWAVWRPAAQVLVSPRPEQPPAPLPPAQPQPGGTAVPARTRGDEPDGLRAYRRGDPLQAVAWKKAAKTLEASGELVSRESHGRASHRLELDWAQCAGLDAEARLSRLAAWVLAAERVGVVYGLALPGTAVPAGLGEAQRRRCLEALALWR